MAEPTRVAPPTQQGELRRSPSSALPAVRLFPAPTMDSDEDHDVTTAAEQKQLRSELATALAAFDRAEDWADLIHDLQRVNRVLSKHARATSLPHKELLAKRLSQCLNASLPSGMLQIHGWGSLSRTVRSGCCLQPRRSASRPPSLLLSSPSRLVFAPVFLTSVFAHALLQAAPFCFNPRRVCLLG